MGSNDATAAYFEEHWPAIAADLAQWLPRMGVPRQDVGDVVQDTAVRLLRSWPYLDPSAPLTRWTRAVARKVWLDRVQPPVRRAAYVAIVPDEPD